MDSFDAIKHLSCHAPNLLFFETSSTTLMLLDLAENVAVVSTLQHQAKSLSSIIYESFFVLYYVDVSKK